MMRRGGNGKGTLKAKGTAPSMCASGECKQRARVRMCVCVLFLGGFECLHCVSGWREETALPLHLKTLRKGQEGGKGQNLSSTLSEPPELCPLTFLPTLPPSPHPLWKISLGNRICPHKKQKSADAA